MSRASSEMPITLTQSSNEERLDVLELQAPAELRSWPSFWEVHLLQREGEIVEKCRKHLFD
jgi:hypothetical protein